MRLEKTNFRMRRPLRSSGRKPAHRDGRRWGPICPNCGDVGDRAAAILFLRASNKTEPRALARAMSGFSAGASRRRSCGGRRWFAQAEACGRIVATVIKHRISFCSPLAIVVMKVEPRPGPPPQAMKAVDAASYAPHAGRAVVRWIGRRFGNGAIRLATGQITVHSLIHLVRPFIFLFDPPPAVGRCLI